MKTIKIVEVKNYRGGKLSVPEFNIDGEIKTEPVLGTNGSQLTDSLGNPVTRPVSSRTATVLSCLDYFVMDFPRTLLTMKNITECTRLHSKVSEAMDKHSDTIELEDAQFEWLVSALKNDKLGVQMFGLNITSLLGALGAS